MSQVTLNPSEISELIRSKIEQFQVVSLARNEGTIVSLKDGIVRLHGLDDVMQGEMIAFPSVIIDKESLSIYKKVFKTPSDT